GVLLGVRGGGGGVAQERGGAHPVALLGRQAVPVRGRGQPGQVQQGRGEVGDVGVLAADPVVAGGAGQSGGPGDDERHPHAAGEGLPLVEPERGVGGLAPAARVVHAEPLGADQRGGVRDVVLPVAGNRVVHEPGEVAAGALRPALGGAAVVGGEHHDGVLQFAECLDGVQDPADALVDAVHHGGVDLHVAGV